MCFGPSTLGAGAKTRLESRIKKCTPHCICRYFSDASNSTNHAFRMMPYPGSTASCYNIQMDDWYELVQFTVNPTTKAVENFRLDVIYGVLWNKA